MTTDEKQKYILDAMDSYKGDNLERANMVYGRMTAEQLAATWGASGRSCFDIWEGYKQDRVAHEESLKYLNELFQ